MKTCFLLIVLAVATPAQSQTLEVVGQAGLLGEWELTATIAGAASNRTIDFAGPFTMTHVGMCAQDGPEKKLGELRVQMASSTAPRLKATLVMDGVECSFVGKLSDSYSGMMTCPDRRGVPLMLWIK